MPDFRLADGEIDSLAVWLQRWSTDRWAKGAHPPPLSARQAQNTETLMRERWGCLGCHALRGDGGRIGPDLAAAGRLRPGYLRAMIEDPAAAAPWTIMPRPLLQPRDIERIVAFLGNMADGVLAGDELSVLDHPTLNAKGAGAAALYETRCAACHGQDGGGAGFNARYLRARPAIHADSGSMSQRPDDTLYDGIHAGARILAGSAEMPAFGASLSSDEIRALVRHMRALCRCAGPPWSRAGGTE
jgi:mono/diheme cytochrome c family protein